MTNDNIAINRAKSLLRKYKLGKITLDNLVFIIEDQGYEIIEYSLSEKHNILSSLNLENYSQGCKAFSYNGNGLKLVFIRDDTSANEKTYALSHELGHIACGHMKGNGTSPLDVEEEREANEFAHYILHPDMITLAVAKYHENKKLAIITMVVVACLLIAIPLVSFLVKQGSYYGEFYVTEAGVCYHEKNCIFVKGKKNVSRLTEGDYYSGKYDPCQICLPND